MWVLLGAVFIASLLGSLHCVGMCGPFALLASADPGSRHAAILPTIAYSLGRLVTYSLVGLIFGAMGMALNQGTSFAHWQQTATYIAGGLMILVGLVALARLAGVSIRFPQLLAPVQKWLQAGFAKTTQMQALPRAMTIGALTTLMPCGWLYTFAITAAGTGSPFWGVALMVSFWAGTVPIMAALVFGFQKIGSRLQQKVPLIMASLVILIGIFTIVYRAPVTLGEETKVVSGIEALQKQISEVDQEKLPCCSCEK